MNICGINPFRHRLRRCHLPQGDGFRGGGKVYGIAQRRPLGGAGALAPEGVRLHRGNYTLLAISSALRLGTQ